VDQRNTPRHSAACSHESMPTTLCQWLPTAYNYLGSSTVSRPGSRITMDTRCGVDNGQQLRQRHRAEVLSNPLLSTSTSHQLPVYVREVQELDTNPLILVVEFDFGGVWLVSCSRRHRQFRSPHFLGVEGEHRKGVSPQAPSIGDRRPSRPVGSPDKHRSVGAKIPQPVGE
jgi:hypothetical protein